MSGRWPYSSCFVGCCFQDLFNIVGSVLVQLPSSFFSIRLVSVHVVHPYSSMNSIAAWKNLPFILSDRSVFYRNDSQSKAVHAFASHVLLSFSVDEMLLLRYVHLSTNFRESPMSGEMSSLYTHTHTHAHTHTHSEFIYFIFFLNMNSNSTFAALQFQV